MSKAIGLLLFGMCALVVLASAAPTLVVLLHNSVLVVVVVGLIAIAMRLAWWFTGRW